MTRSCIKEIKKYLENEESENIVEEEVKAESVQFDAKIDNSDS